MAAITGVGASIIDGGHRIQVASTASDSAACRNGRGWCWTGSAWPLAEAAVCTEIVVAMERGSAGLRPKIYFDMAVKKDGSTVQF